MNKSTQQPESVRSFDELTAGQQASAGGKGGMLARLHQKGYPVPDGFVILPTAFEGDDLKSEAWAQVRAHLGRLRQADRDVAFAVRSSALSEDSAQASFAGEFETVLDVHSEDMIQAAIHTVRHSRHSERVRAYSQAKGIDAAHDMAIVVQRLVRADISGVLFTANPITGSRAEMTGNFVFGFGEELVSGEAEPYTFTFERPRGHYDGPPDLQRFARRLYKLASRLEKDLGYPQDIEWCVADRRLYLLQSRPITTLIEHDPTTGERNSTFTGDYLWTNMIVGEVFPTSTTPSTWSVWRDFFEKLSFGDVSAIGMIAGRPYLNYSLMYSFLMKIMRKHERVMDLTGDSVGVPPEGLEVPSFPVSMKTLVFQLIPREFKNERKKAELKRNVSEFLTMIHDRCQELGHQIEETQGKDVLISLWAEDIRPLLNDLYLLQDKMNEELQGLNRKLDKEVRELLGQDEAATLLTTMSGSSGELASLGPLVGLSKLRKGEMDRRDYLKRYGHRGPNENELAEPRPSEDPDWLDKQLAELSRSPVDVTQLLAKRSSEFDTVWKKVERRMPPKKAGAIKRKIGDVAEANALREATRSELTRLMGVVRALFLRAGELTGLGDSIFFLTIDEVGDVLSGDTSSTAYIPARRETFEKYRALPPLPAWIRGRFDPFLWAADPNRRMDVFDSHAPLPSTLDSEGVVRGHPGSAGRAEGTVRRMDSPDEGEQLQPGEILVASTTNVGWTPLFPRAAAIVTDIGGSLSHAAIVAREIGIPAVVGCGNATMRLKTGDRVLVDGGRGVVQLLETA